MRQDIFCGQTTTAKGPALRGSTLCIPMLLPMPGGIVRLGGSFRRLTSTAKAEMRNAESRNGKGKA
jgi:hypothetical protein